MQFRPLPTYVCSCARARCFSNQTAGNRPAEKRKTMSLKSERKKAIKAQKQAQEKDKAKVIPVQFEGFDFSHDENCKCNLETIDTIEDLLIEFGFVELPCRFSEESKVESHTVYIPENFEATCPHCRLRVW